MGYIIKTNGQLLGPLSLEELKRLISRGELFFEDPVFPEHGSVWQRVADCPELHGPPRPRTPIRQGDFFLLKGNSLHQKKDLQLTGPWCPDEIKQALKRREISLFDYTFSMVERNWLRLLDYPFFAEVLTPLPSLPPSATSTPAPPQVGRRFPRCSFSGQVLLCLNKEGHKRVVASCQDLGEGGCLIQTPSTPLGRGEEFDLSMYPDSAGPRFHCRARIASFRPGRPGGIGLEFLALPEQNRQEVATFVQKSLKREGKNL